MFTPAQKPRGFAKMIRTRQLPSFPDFILPWPLPAAKPRKQHRHPGGWRCRQILDEWKAAYLSFASYSTLLTVMIFLSSFSETVPVTSPFLASLQTLL